MLFIDEVAIIVEPVLVIIRKLFLSCKATEELLSTFFK
jgi:hypothetical protein